MSGRGLGTQWVLCALDGGWVGGWGVGEGFGVGITKTLLDYRQLILVHFPPQIDVERGGKRER